MKLVILVSVACIAACATKSPQVAPHTVVEQPKTENTDTQSNANEQNLFDESIAKIGLRIRDENLQLAMCVEVNGAKACLPMLAQFCTADSLVDSRGDMHKKPFCANYHNIKN